MDHYKSCLEFEVDKIKMKVLILSVVVHLSHISTCTAATIFTFSKESTLSALPPPQSPNTHLNGDEVKDHKLLQEPVQKLIDQGGYTVKIDREFQSSKEEEKFKQVMSEATNRYCSSPGNCYGEQKTVGAADVVRYNLEVDGTSWTAVSYVKNPAAYTELTMTKEQLGKMVMAERTEIEKALGLNAGETKTSSNLPLYYWVITLALVVVVFAVVGAFVCCVHYRNKKRDSNRTIDDKETSYRNNNKVYRPDMSGLAAVKTTKVDTGTNVYQAEIIAETKTVFLRSPNLDTTTDANTELYAVVRKNTKEQKRQNEKKDDPGASPDPSPNIIVVTAQISSNEGSSHPDADDDVAGPSSYEPPSYNQIIGLADGAEVVSTPTLENNLPQPPSNDDLPLPPPPDVGLDSASSLPQELPPPPDEFQKTEDPVYAQDPKSPPPRRDSRASSSPSSGKASSSAVKDVDEAVRELENLIADQSKEIADQGLDNAAFNTTINEDGEPTTEL